MSTSSSPAASGSSAASAFPESRSSIERQPSAALSGSTGIGSGLRIAHVGTYPPRKCGIATYTQDVVTAVHTHMPAAAPVVIAMDMADENISYSWPVQHIIPQQDEASYTKIAQRINKAGMDLVSIQHEHGIFGGDHGRMLKHFIDALNVPVVATLHTVLPQPSEGMIASIRELSERAAHLVVLNSRAIPLLQNAYGINTDNVSVIPHGTPDVDPERRSLVRERFNVTGQTVLSTFGLISPGKGLEHAIAAVAAVADKHPNLHYYILGATHPGIVRHSGESYRDGLKAQAEELGVADRIHFVNQYLSLDDLTDWLLATDIYVTPYLNPHQIVSGTLAYAVAAGKPVLSTPYLHAQELLEGGRGILTPFNDPATMAKNLDELVSDEAGRQEMSRLAWEFGRTSSWPAVARRYWDVFNKVMPAAAAAPTAGARRPMAPTATIVSSAGIRVAPKLPDVAPVQAKPAVN